MRRSAATSIRGDRDTCYAVFARYVRMAVHQKSGAGPCYELMEISIVRRRLRQQPKLVLHFDSKTFVRWCVVGVRMATVLVTSVAFSK